jgi:hypothetical protein
MNNHGAGRTSSTALQLLEIRSRTISAAHDISESSKTIRIPHVDLTRTAESARAPAFASSRCKTPLKSRNTGIKWLHLSNNSAFRNYPHCSNWKRATAWKFMGRVPLRRAEHIGLQVAFHFMNRSSDMECLKNSIIINLKKRRENKSPGAEGDTRGSLLMSWGRIELEKARRNVGPSIVHKRLSSCSSTNIIH